MYVSSITRKFAPWFKQTVVNGSYKNKSITITTNYINDLPSFKSVSVLDQDTFRECGKMPILGRFQKVYDTVMQRKRK